MDKIVKRSTKLLTLEEAKAAIAFHQPKLRASQDGEKICIEGSFLILENNVVAAPAGPLDEFQIRIELSERYPWREPKTFEVGGRIPREAARHINTDGDCCVTVWENWLATADDHSLAAYLKGPLQEYFLGQLWFEKTGNWPFGERSHGTHGLEEAYADAIGIACNRVTLIRHLQMLSHGRIKGHWPCPCGSGHRVRRCHQSLLRNVSKKISPHIARRMLSRLTPKPAELRQTGF